MEVDRRWLHGLHCAGCGHRIAKNDTFVPTASQMCPQAGCTTKLEPRLRQRAPEVPPPPPDPDGAAHHHSAAQRPSGDGAATPTARTAQSADTVARTSLPTASSALPSGNGRSDSVQPMSETPSVSDHSATAAADTAAVRGTAAPQRRIANRCGDLFASVCADGDGRGPQPREPRGPAPVAEANLRRCVAERGYADSESIRRRLQTGWVVGT